MGRLDGKTALVTGATRGIGRGIAEGFAREGATVAVNHRPVEDSRQRAEDVVEAIREAGGDAESLAGDVSDEESVRSMVDGFEDRFGPTDVLVNNAGIMSLSLFANMPVEQWDRLMAVNLRGVFLTTRFALPGMLDAGSGKIINMASEFGVKGEAGAVHYSAAKGGVIGMTRALAREVSPTVHVNAIAPGTIETDMMDENVDERWVDQRKSELAMDRFGSVDEVVPTAVFLASEDSDYYTGQTLHPNGGRTMR